MLCGAELFLLISQDKANWVCQKFGLYLKKEYNSKQERIIHDKPGTYLRDGKYRNLVIEVKRSGDEYSLTIRGSLHKFYHGNNKGFFAGHEIMKAKEDLCKIFQIDEQEVQILNLEIGPNIPVWFDVYPYLKRNLLYHKKIAPVEIPKTSKVGFQFKHDDYLIKLYNKGHGLLRCEVKYTSKKDLERRGLLFLSGITETTVNNLAADSLEAFSEVVMADGMNIFLKEDRHDKLTPGERESLLEFTSQLFMSSYNETLREVDDSKKVSMRQKKYRLKKKCLKLIQDYGNGDQNQIFETMCDQVEVFINSWDDNELPDTVNVTNSAIIKEGENVTKGIISSILTQDCNKTLSTMNTVTVKSKKKVAKEKREQENKRRQGFITLLGITLKKIERDAA